MSRRNGRMIAGGRIVGGLSGREQILSAFRLSVALPLEMTGYHVRCKTILADEHDEPVMEKGPVAGQVHRRLQFTVVDPYALIELTGGIDEDKVAVAAKPHELSAALLVEFQRIMGGKRRQAHDQAAWFARLIQSKRGPALYVRFRAWIERRGKVKA